jgi:hypothetical protein
LETLYRKQGDQISLWKNHPKCSPNIFCQIQYINYVKISAAFVIFQKLPNRRKICPIWSPWRLTLGRRDRRRAKKIKFSLFFLKSQLVLRIAWLDASHFIQDFHWRGLPWGCPSRSAAGWPDWENFRLSRDCLL